MYTPEYLKKFHKPAPRYTSYPTAVDWGSIDTHDYTSRLKKLGTLDEPISLYFHIPFCHSMCLYCGCSVVLNRKAEKEREFVDYLKKEIDLVTQALGTKKKVTQLHFGGGTPTKLSPELLQELFDKIQEAFEIDFSKEVSIEIDPRTVVQDDGAKLKLLYKLGFNRVSFGVQDTNPKVQEAIKRRQSLEMTQQTYYLARQLGFKGINLDLIYGLPYQTSVTFAKTIEDIIELKPDRIAMFSYAKVPWLKPHQKAMKESTLPSTEEKFEIYFQARQRLIESGYLGIGMDHFALQHDEMSRAFVEKKLQRNFQGYTLPLANHLLGFGVTAIGSTQNGYFQNLKTLKEYYHALDQDQLPVTHGKILSTDDELRRWVIHTLMCHFELSKKEFASRYHIPFDKYFEGISDDLQTLESEGLLQNNDDYIKITLQGELLIRNIVINFDFYRQVPTTSQKFSHSI